MLNGLSRSLASPSRNPRMATVLGRLLGIAFIVTFGTGLYSHFLQDPLPWMVFPTRPTFLYQLSQGIHITAGIACVPLILGKLYVVFPELFQTPPVRSFSHFLERASIALFVAASLVEITIGLLNTFQFYSLFPFPFKQTHFALSFVIIGSLAIHIGVKLDVIAKYWRKKDSYDADGNVADFALPESPKVRVSAAPQDAEQPERVLSATASAAGATGATAAAGATEATGAGGQPAAATGVTGRLFAWIDATPQPSPTTSRRGFVATIAVATAAVVAFTAGQSFRPLDGVNLFAPRKAGIGPNALPVNRTARAAGVLESAVAPDWVLTVVNGDTSRSFTLAELAELPQRDVDLPIACVEGWSQNASWRGPRLLDLLDTVGADAGVSIRATSLEEKGGFRLMDMGPEFVRDDLTLVALEVNGQVLDIDHGYPARIIAPARPGVRQTKWLSMIEVI
ncbi:molybdopterin-dependent oxidoreductase [Marisediminicola antarctica]|uniref:Molybdopterin-binding protein n=2 Tax=Marisediminicola antarctica TaxID=674079 RepID=A0A7L5AKY0_9MICO|nr:molybdopterin-binding protein [Marisediminicola antarctica]